MNFMAIVVDDPTPRIIAFRDSSTWYGIKISSEEITHNSSSSPGSANHSAIPDFIPKPFTAFSPGRRVGQKIQHRHARMGELAPIPAQTVLQHLQHRFFGDGRN